MSMLRNLARNLTTATVGMGTLLAGSPALHAQAPTFLTTFENQSITMVDISDGSTIIAPNGREVANRGEADVNYRVRPALNGFDLTVTFTNDGVAPVPLGNITIPGIRFGQVVNYADLRFDSKIGQFDHQGRNFFGPGRVYPRELYSPAFILGDERYWMGVSVLYPVVEYNHSVQLQARVPGGALNSTGRNWEIDCKLIDELPAGEAREYTFAVRLVRVDEPWVKALLPYRDYFHDLYGPVQYQRDPRPVMSYNMAGNEFASPTNPFGFSASSIRPDIVGYQPHAERLLNYHNDDGHVRIMAWTPSGVFLNNQGNNYPFPFMSNMMNVPQMASTRHFLADVPAPPLLEIGYWWGRSSQVMTGWDVPDWTAFSVDNPDHVARGLREIELARELNATMVGLDAYVYHNSIADAFLWLTMLREAAPEIRFVVEPSPPDIIHFQAGAFTDAVLVKNEKVLADFLLPGHESWAQIRYDVLKSRLGRELTDTEKVDEINRVTSLGFVPVIPAGNKRVEAFIAAESWRNTIPEDIRLAAPRWNTNYDAADANLGDNGRFTIVSDAPPPLGGDSFVDPRTGRVRRGVVGGYVPSAPITRPNGTTNVAGILTNRGADPLPIKGRGVPLRMSPTRNTPLTRVAGEQIDEIEDPETQISRAGKIDPPLRSDVIAVPRRSTVLPSWARTYIPSSSQVRDALRRARQRPADENVIAVAGADDGG